MFQFFCVVRLAVPTQLTQSFVPQKARRAPVNNRDEKGTSMTGLVCGMRCAGTALLGWLLQQRSPTHLGMDVLVAIEALLRATAGHGDLQRGVLAALLLDRRLWVAAAPPVQLSLAALTLRLCQARISARSPPCPVLRLMSSSVSLHH